MILIKIFVYLLAALKVKLMVRRPITALVAQGILPSPKTSPALHEQRQKLERAKMGDMLRAKIARRPDRSELVHRHILEDVRPGVDPRSLSQFSCILSKGQKALAYFSLSHRPNMYGKMYQNVFGHVLTTKTY